MAEWVLLLECGHVVPDNGSAVSARCPRHQSMQAITERNAGYSYRCYNCPAGAKTGLAKLLALHKRDQHLRRYSTHRAAVKLGNEVVDVRGFEKQPTLFDSVLTDEPPF